MEFVKPPKDLESQSKSQLDSSPDPYRSLTQLKKSLEHYKNLCEQRILEIYPNHPLPVKEEHLGTPIPYLNDLHLAKQKIVKLEEQIRANSPVQEDPRDSIDQKYNKLIKDKLLLEESLRAEVLNSEAQRAYIEVLKQALEENIEENRKKSEIAEKESGKVEKIKEQGKEVAKSGNLDVRREVANLKNMVKDLESQVDRAKAAGKAKEAELKMFFSEKENLTSKFKELSEALQSSQEENLKLEEEKSSLLDYIEEHSQKEAEMEKDMNELEKLFEGMKENYTETMKKYEEEMKSNKHNAEELQTVHEELDKANKMIREMQKSSSVLKEKLQDTQNQCKQVKEDKQGLEIKCESLLASVTMLSETLKETQMEVESYSVTVEKLKRSVSEKEELIYKQKTEVSGKNQEISSLKNINQMLEIEKTSKISEKNEIFKQFENEKQKNSALEDKNTAAEMRIRNLELEIKDRQQLEKTLKSELAKLSQYKQDFDRLMLEYSELQHKEKVQASLIQDLRHINNERSQESDTLFRETQKNRQENEELLRELQDFEKMVMENKLLQQLLNEEKKNMEHFKEVLNADKSVMENKLKILQNSEYKSNELIDFLQKQLQEEEKIVTSLKKDLNEALYKIENQEVSHLTLQNRLFACVQAVFDTLPLSHNTFSSTFSDSFKDLIYKLQNNPIPDILDICAFSELAADHIKFLYDINFDLHDEINAKNYEISLNISRIESLSAELQSQKSHFSLYSEKFSKENSSLKSDLQLLSQQNRDLKNNLNMSFKSLQNLRVNSDHIENNLKSLQCENTSLKTEKNQLENLLTTKKNFFEEQNYNVQIEILEHERKELQTQLSKLDSDPTKSNGVLFRDLKQKLMLCERQILNFNKLLASHGRTETPLRYKPQVSEYGTAPRSHFEDTTPPRRERSMFN